VAKRLKPLQGRKGGILGGKALVALELRSGLAVAMATDPDGETNDAKLVPALLPQVRSRVAGPRLWVADRQFGDLTQTAAFAAGEDHFVVRYHPKTHFCPDSTRLAQQGHDPQGRAWVEDWGWLGCARAKQRRFVRRITLYRPGEETVILLTDLLDAEQYPANDLLGLYLARWGIERVFQQVTEVFHLQALIGTTPQGTVFQCAFVCCYTTCCRWSALTSPPPKRARPRPSQQNCSLTMSNGNSWPSLNWCRPPRSSPCSSPCRLRSKWGSNWPDSWRRSGPRGGSRLPQKSPNPRSHGTP
jgi:hypothetical protein